MERYGFHLLIVGIVLLLMLVMWAIGAYNGFMKTRNLVQESWKQVDVELKRRYDLIPNLVQTVQGYAAHEKAVFEQVTAARSQAGAAGGVEARAQGEAGLSSALRQLFAVAENYPTLKANTNFLALQEELTRTEDRIAAARRFYNGNVRALNTRLETFPSNLIGSMAKVQRAEYFELDEPAARVAPTVQF